MRIYLDNCCYSRPSDDQSQNRIQQSDKGYGDYTKEKYDVDEPDWNTLNSEFDAFKKAGGDARHLAIIK